MGTNAAVMPSATRKPARGHPKAIKTEQDNLTSPSPHIAAELVDNQVKGTLGSSGNSLYSATDVAAPAGPTLPQPNGRSDARKSHSLSSQDYYSLSLASLKSTVESPSCLNRNND